MGAAEIFDTASRWVTYQADVHIFTLVGGIPKDPDTIRKWVKARLELADTEVMAIAEETLAAMGWTRVESSEQLDQLVDAVMAADTKGNSFKMDERGELVYEGRCLKAALKEAANALYPGTAKWPGHPGPAVRKGLASWLTERVEVVDRYLPLGRTTPDIAGEQRIKHVSGPQGKRSAVNVVDLVEDVKISARIAVLDDCIPPELWSDLWQYVERGGLGADRARGDGRCELTAWQRIDRP
jgi:hypothetical protein